MSLKTYTVVALEIEESDTSAIVVSAESPADAVQLACERHGWVVDGDGEGTEVKYVFEGVAQEWL